MSTSTFTFNNEQLSEIFAASKGVLSANRAVEKANEKREGSYSTLTRLASEMNQADFTSAMGSLFELIRANTDSAATKVGAKKGDKGGWIIPNALSAAKSVLSDAFEYGVPMLDEEDGETPRAFSQIRQAVKDAKKSEQDAERTQAEIQRDLLVEHLRHLADEIAKDDPDSVMGDHYGVLYEACNTWVIDMDSLSGEQEEQSEAA